MNAIARPVLTPEERIEDWIFFHLARARQCRMRLERLERGTVAYGAENHFRHLALQQATKHVVTLHGLGAPLSAELVEAMQTECL